MFVAIVGKEVNNHNAFRPAGVNDACEGVVGQVGGGTGHIAGSAACHRAGGSVGVMAQSLNGCLLAEADLLTGGIIVVDDTRCSLKGDTGLGREISDCDAGSSHTLVLLVLSTISATDNVDIE